MTVPPPTAAQMTLLARLLEQEAQQLEAFAQMLEREWQALQGNDAEALASASEHKAQLAETLQHLERQKLRIAASTVGGDEALQRQALQAWQSLPPLNEHWQRIRTLGQQCRQANERNGVAIRERLQWVQQALTVLLETDARLTTYDGGGRTHLSLGTASRKLGSA